jgi:hypothetical protein
VRRAALLVVLAAAVLTGTSGAVVPGVPSIYVTYSPNCTFTMTVDGGTTVTATSPPGPTLPPGQYQIQVLMENPAAGYSCGTPVFTLTGPGVSSSTTFPQESILDNHVLPPLRPSSTYTAEDENAPAATHVYFTTAASGSSSSLLSPATTTTTTTKGGSTQTDIVGSGVLPERGRLAATVPTAGRATLKLDGRSVTSLTPGRYDVAVVDASTAAGFWLERPGGKRVALTGVRFRGRETRAVTMTSGRWTSSAGSFVVR